jgi:hypothetical protein
MLRKLTDTVSYNLLSLLAVLFIAVGMPLLHPVLHNHFEHYHIIENHGAEQHSEIPSKDKEYECSICDFRATNQFFVSGLAPIMPAGEPLGITLSIIPIFFLVKVRSTQTKPRAPPNCTY